MYCPVCRDEFRPGFTRCANCDVDLVEQLPSGETASPPGRAPQRQAPAFVPMVEYCGFVSLDDARDARSTLRNARIRTEILIRDAVDTDAEEEYWLRVERARFQEATGLLGYDAAEASTEDETPTCGACGERVRAEESFCARCGERFEGD